MKKLLIPFVFILGVASYPALIDTFDVVQHLAPENKVVDKIQSVIFKGSLGYGSTNALVGRCTKDVSQNGHGWVFVRRNYWSCGKIAIKISDLIYGEYTKPIDPELAKQLCKDCTF